MEIVALVGMTDDETVRHLRAIRVGNVADLDGDARSVGGATLTARLLQRAGWTDVWQWSDNALLRAAEFLNDHGGYAPRHRANQYIPHEINAAYGTTLGPVATPGHGRQFGFTDWLGG